jgi:hypothetical protein
MSAPLRKLMSEVSEDSQADETRRSLESVHLVKEDSRGVGLSAIATRVKQRGVLKFAEDLALRAANRVMFLKILHCMKLDTVNPEYLSTPENYRGMFVAPEQLEDFIQLPEYEFTRGFVEQAFAKGDQCYAFITRDGVLAAYQWYSTTPTWYFTPSKRSGWNSVVVSFPDQYVYMYKAFTHPAHRGKRLYPIGVTTALAGYLAKGYKGILSVVESNNFASLRACYRMGYRDFGRIRVAVLLGWCLLHADPSCRAYGLQLTKKDYHPTALIPADWRNQSYRSKHEDVH